MNFSLYIAKRYLFSPGSSNAINIITGIAAAGVVIGAMSLFIVLSGFAGLKDFSLQFSSYFDPDLKVFPLEGKTIALSNAQRTNLDKVNGIASYAEVIEQRVFLEYKDKTTTAFIKGVSESYNKVVKTDSILLTGNWITDNDAQVVAGWGVSRELGMGVEQVYTNFLKMYVPKPGKGIPSNPDKAFRKKAAVNIGVYAVNEELDKKYVFSTINMARELLGYDQNTVTHLELKLKPEADSELVRSQIETIFRKNILIKNREQLNETLYKMLNTEHLASYLIITLIAIIALFNVAGAIIMMIIDKKNNIKTLHNVGASLGNIRKVFLYQGSLMTILGALLGILLGFIVILCQQRFELLMITPSLPYPTQLLWSSFIVVFLTITTIGCVASLLASSRINKKLVTMR